MTDPDAAGPDAGLPRRLLERGLTVLAALPARDRLRLLDRAARRLVGGSGLTQLVHRVASESGLSEPVAREVVLGMAREWREARMARAVAADLGGVEVLDGFVPLPGCDGDRVRAVPDRLALHVGSGTVPGVSATSLARSFVVGSPVLLKPGRRDRVLAQALREALVAEHPPLAEAVGVAWWPGGEGGELEDRALALAERVVVHGSDETVASLARRLPPSVPLVAHPHRVSLGLVAAESVAGTGARDLARAMASALAAYDQRGCVSPRRIWVEDDGSGAVAGLEEALVEALVAAESERPAGPLGAEARAAIRQMRDVAELVAVADDEGSGGGEVRVPPDGGSAWTLLVDPGGRMAADAGGRVAALQPVARLEDALPVLARLGPALQSVAVEAGAERRQSLAEALAGLGATRITTFRRQPWPPAWWHHDGRGPLEPLVRWVTLEAPGSGPGHSSS